MSNLAVKMIPAVVVVLLLVVMVSYHINSLMPNDAQDTSPQNISPHAYMPKGIVK